MLLNVVTGGGKTALIAATMVWLRLAHDVRRFLILCPNLIVRDRLEADFRGGKVFTERDLIPPGAIVSADDFALTTLGGTSSATATSLLGSNVVLANIHQFYRSSTTGKQNLWSLLEADQTPFAVFNDEAHNTPAPGIRPNAARAARACRVPLPPRYHRNARPRGRQAGR